MNANSPARASLFSSRAAWIAALLLILGLGLAIRLYDLTDLPLDFHPTRQLLSALKARGMYYETLTDVPAEQRSFAIQQWRVRAAIEPEILERMVAFTYQFTGEQLWIARIYSSFFWLIGAVFLFLLARELTSTDGALAAAAVYLFLPYAIPASRSFQPDPLMVMLIVLFWWAVYKWAAYLPSPDFGRGVGVREAWLFALLAGLFGGLAILVKFVAAFFVIGGGLGAVLGHESIRETVRRPQVYAMTALGILPGAVYVIYGVWIAGYLGQQFGGRFIPSLFLSPSYYLGWIEMLNLVVGGVTLMLALSGLFFLREGPARFIGTSAGEVRDEKLRFMLGLWAGYALFGLTFNYHISSHDYYSLPLIPIVGLSLAPLADWFLAQLARLTSGRARIAAFCLLLFGLSATLLNTRAEMKSVDYRPEAGMWSEIGAALGDAKVAGLTQDYGTRLAYWGWKNLTPWPNSGDLIYHVDLRDANPDFEKLLNEATASKDLFLVTDFDELDRQPFLKQKLYSTYPIFSEGDRYVIFDLLH